MMKGMAVAVLLLGAGVAAWVGSEAYAVRQVRQAVADSPALQAASVAALRDPRAWGMRIEALEWSDPAVGLAMDWAELSLGPGDPFRLRMALPQAMTLRVSGREIPLDLAAPSGAVDFAPLRRMAPAEIDVATGAVISGGAPMLDDGRLQARLVQVDARAPLSTLAAYDVDLGIEGLRPAALAALGLPAPDGAWGLEGRAQIWLDGAPSPFAATPPRPTGFRSDGLSLSLGEASARMLGHLGHDAEGRARGQLAIYTADADAFLDQVAALGLIDRTARMLLSAGLRNIASSGATSDFPAAEGDEIRLLLGFEDGRMSVGGIPVGPAPMIR